METTNHRRRLKTSFSAALGGISDGLERNVENVDEILATLYRGVVGNFFLKTTKFVKK
jgi:hypothetical protein